MSRRVLSIGSIINQPTSHFNAYKSGSGVGGTSQSVRRALQRRATLNSGTMANPKSGTCTAHCNYCQISTADLIQYTNNLNDLSFNLSVTTNANYTITILSLPTQGMITLVGDTITYSPFDTETTLLNRNFM